MTIDLDRVAPEAVPGIRIMPVLHERVDVAALVQGVLARLDPDAVAVELPTTLDEFARRAVARLPAISVVISEDPGEEALIWIVAPGDPLVEAMRWAADREREVILIDPDVRYRHRRHDRLPDSYSMHSIGIDRYIELIRDLGDKRMADEADHARERGMAYHLTVASERIGGSILALVGATHARRLAGFLAGPTAIPLARQSRSHVMLRHLHPDSLTAVLPDPPLAHAVFEILRSTDPPLAVDLAETVAPRIELPVAGLTVISGGSEADRPRRARSVAHFTALHARRTLSQGLHLVDRADLADAVWRIAAASYEEQTRTATSQWQRRLFFDFARRCARIKGQLCPGLYEWVVAARGVGDDNLAWEVFDAARSFPWQDARSDIESARIDGDELDLGTRKIRFRRRFFRVKQRPVVIPVRRRPAPEDPAEWLQAFDGEGICSYPPEDIIVEDWGRYLKGKATSVLSAERSRSEPFTTSMLDGIDLRETLQRLHEGRIWVREQGRAPGAVGSVVVIFDEDREGRGFPYLMSWLGEHEQESDMAFYATNPVAQIVGPGIMRATYGGFMLTYPPGRLFDVWRDPDYLAAGGKAEVLLMSAIDYSTEKVVVHVAATPPPSRLADYAAQRGKRVVHLPIGSLSPISLAKVRVVHILAGRDKRDMAKDYIW